MDEAVKIWLEGMGFAPAKGKEGLFWKKIDEKTTAYWDFRKQHAEKGNFYVTIEGLGFEGKESSEKQPEYTGLRELQKKGGGKQTSIEAEGKGEKEKPGGEVSSGSMVEEEKPKETPPSAISIFEKIQGIVENDVLELFGPTGSGKSKIVWHIALDAIEKGKTVYYLDTERNISKKDVEALGDFYHYTPLFSEIEEIAKNLPRADVYIIDSIGFPVLTAFSRMNLRERGDALLGMISILGSLKEKCYKEGAIAIVTNQPISELGVESDEKVEDRRPFGDKAAFSAKEIWRTTAKVKGKEKTVIQVDSWRSRNMGFGTVIMEVEISDKGVVFNWMI